MAILICNCRGGITPEDLEKTIVEAVESGATLPKHVHIAIIEKYGMPESGKCTAEIKDMIDDKLKRCSKCPKKQSEPSVS
ncbi:MAG: hypothetical protein AB7G06_07440 [Bdellovibrionales bacterium]